MIFQEHRRVLRIIYERLQYLDAPWAITGSLGFALHGMDIPINDIDLQTDRNGAYQIEETFQSNIVRHVTFSESTIIRSYFGELKIAGNGEQATLVCRSTLRAILLHLYRWYQVSCVTCRVSRGT